MQFFQRINEICISYFMILSVGSAHSLGRSGPNDKHYYFRIRNMAICGRREVNAYQW